MEMLNAIFKAFANAFSNPQYHSYALLILPPGLSPKRHLTYIRLTSEHPGIIEKGDCPRPTFPRGVSIKSREPLGRLAVQVTEGQSFEDAIKELTEVIQEAYDDDAADLKGDATISNDAINNRNKILRRSGSALRQGFSRMMMSEKTPQAGSQLYTVDLALLSKPKPGPILDLLLVTIPYW
ncbi:hypothetical protein FQN49_003513 [Arthroderma sp. PD_2]|nr:hypothetical protein FQN49_003513 [Arthroderma sp. PD_2]